VVEQVLSIYKDLGLIPSERERRERERETERERERERERLAMQAFYHLNHAPSPFML
jgi:hypothetical protein